MTATEPFTSRDYADIGFAVGYSGGPLAEAVRGLGVASGVPLTAADRRAVLDGWRQGEYCRAMDDANPGDFGGPIDWTGVPF